MVKKVQAVSRTQMPSPTLEPGMTRFGPKELVPSSEGIALYLDTPAEDGVICYECSEAFGAPERISCDDKTYHLKCFHCGFCENLIEPGPFLTKHQKPLCTECLPTCFQCHEKISTECVVRGDNLCYHRECFKCSVCQESLNLCEHYVCQKNELCCGRCEANESVTVESVDDVAGNVQEIDLVAKNQRDMVNKESPPAPAPPKKEVKFAATPNNLKAITSPVTKVQDASVTPMRNLKVTVSAKVSPTPPTLSPAPAPPAPQAPLPPPKDVSKSPAFGKDEILQIRKLITDVVALLPDHRRQLLEVGNLQDILRTVYGADHLVHFCMEEGLCLEKVYFWLQMEYFYRRSYKWTNGETYQMAQYLNERFLVNKARFDIQPSPHIRFDMDMEISTGTVKVESFHDAFKEVVDSLRQQVIPRFLESKFGKAYLKESLRAIAKQGTSFVYR